MKLDQKALLSLLLHSIEASGWQALVASPVKPFELRLFRGESRGPLVSVYIWNCTHGGGSARAPDEYRIQVTGVVPQDHPDAITLLLGWHSGYEVFAAWDIGYHNGQDSSSPFAQIREEVLAQAHSRQFAVGTRANGELVVAFRPEFLVDYAINARSLHRTGEIADEFGLLNRIEEVGIDEIEAIENPERRKVVSTIYRRYRAADFRRRVLGAYNHRCAMCGVQLNLLDAAHIMPVAADNSTDDTNNGVALCKLHHAAFDRNLVSFDESYRIEVSDSELQRLAGIQRGGGADDFRNMLKDALVLPGDRRDYPPSSLIESSRAIRGWRN
jgi:putative restriction endonuclease